ncbi:MAG TPA: Rossmann-like and DUF2520 domain-containing protein [Chitinophagaceae bacterium]|nr:Rossmann-like and DUF2520 domain-containing protein [Chitinophagaceae bacterium]
MDIVLIGTGNAATVLGKKFKGAGHTIVQVVGRHAGPTHLLATALDAAPCYNRRDMSGGASLYLAAVSDQALPEMAKEWLLPNCLLAHTAGAVSVDVFKNASAQYGVFYPLQSLRKEIDPLPEIPVLIDGNSEGTRQKLLAIAQTISPLVSEAGDAQRLQLHLAAVLVNNFTNHLYALAENYCVANGLDFRYLLPLIKETAVRVERFSPRLVQTGPAARNDADTIRRHLELLKDDEHLREVYSLLTGSIQKGV